MFFMANCLILFLVHWCACGLEDLPFFTCSPKYSNMQMIDTYLSLTSKWWFWCLNLNHHLLFGQTMGILLQIWCKIGSIELYEWVTFSWKIGTCMGLLSNSAAAHPYQNQTWVPPSHQVSQYVYLSLQK